MAKQDFFQEIAMTKHPISVLDKEIEPAAVPAVWFRQDEEIQGQIEGIRQPSFEERCEEFQAELECLRRQYKPFLKNYLPGLPKEVTRRELRKFAFRYLEQGEVFTKRNAPEKQWEDVMIPDYRGPAEEKGKWKAYYRCSFSGEDFNRKQSEGGIRAVLEFECVDYIAEIYVNGNFVGSHEGFFAPFSFDITDDIEKEENELIILCKNDYTILGTGPLLDGDKIYAATGPGWDDPDTGWHHCPAGAGVFGKVSLAFRAEIYVEDIFVRPDIDQNSVEVRVGIQNYTDQVCRAYGLSLNLIPRNFRGASIGKLQTEVACIGPGKNEYRYFLPLGEYRLWDGESPWLYGALAILEKDSQVISCASQNFGIKKFISDEKSTPKGRFYLNNKPIVLRGANEMGHLQQCVMQGDTDQLVDDILIAKMCHMNYYRVTQRPVQEEIYDYFDMLGMMHQCDLPLFGFLRRPQFAEALRQTGEMEHMIRKHVSTCMVSFINEPVCIRKTEDANDKFSRRYMAKGHRHLLRDELEAFFAAARKAIYVENPDRVIKNVEGDYDGPTAEGMPDFHSYTMWYTNHGQPIGKLMRGYLPPVKSGWMMGCGEYGAEGLDNEPVMWNRYPKAWLQTDGQGHWYPDKIIRAQTHSVQGDWYEEQDNVKDWVRESQIHQAKATKLMTDAYRRRGDLINHTAIHLLIDAWPAGWMKTLVDCERQPKRAYFAYQDALVPKRVNLYTGRTCVYEDEKVAVEAWILNDTGEEHPITVKASLWEEGEEKPYASYSVCGFMAAAHGSCLAKIPVSFRKGGKDRRKLYVKAELLDEKDSLLNREVISFEVYRRVLSEQAVQPLGEESEELCRILTKGKPCTQKEKSVLLCSLTDAESIKKLEQHVKIGGKGILFLPEEPVEVNFAGSMIKTRDVGGVFFAAAEGAYREYPLSMLYNHEKKYIDMTAVCTIETELSGKNHVFTYDHSGFGGSSGAKKHLPFIKECRVGKGTLILVSLKRSGLVGCNPGLDRLLQKLLEQ